MTEPATATPTTYAALDLGSNSFHLLIARADKGRFDVLDRHKETVRLASGLQKDGTLSAAAVERALASLTRFAERLRSTPDAQIRVVGTNTLRAARNADKFLRQAEAILGTPIHIISGAEEARLTFRAVAGDFAPESRRLVIDIGGGSTEVIMGKQRIEALVSLPMGCVSYSTQFFPDGRLSSSRYRQAVKAARVEVQDHVETFAHKKWTEAVGSSGTIKAVETILEALGLNSDHSISLPGLEQLAELVCAQKSLDELTLPGLADDRRQVIVGGLAILHALFLELDIDDMHVSSYAVREGVIFDLIDRDFAADLRSETVAAMMARYGVDTAQVARAQAVAELLLKQNRDHFGKEFRRCRKRLTSAICLHEIGLAISHDDFHVHGAYLLEHSDMPGFSKLEQKHLSFLVLNHRRRLMPMPETYGFTPNWDLVLILRLACLFSRRRDDDNVPDDLRLKFSDDGATLSLSPDWLTRHPLTLELLKKERKYLARQHYELHLDT